MGARGHIGHGFSAGDGGDRLGGEHKYPRQIFVPAAGEQHLLRLPLQSGHGDLGEALLLGGVAKGFIQGTPWNMASHSGTSSGGGRYWPFSAAWVSFLR